jgi:hypothetical protein
MAKTVADAAATMVANLREKTGKSLDEWVKLARASGRAKHGELVGFLKSEHGIGHGYANMIAMEALKAADAPEGDQLVEAQYAEAKAAVRPIYDALVKAIRAFGPDVELAPKKAYVSLRRSKQFGLIQPSTPARVDVGINLKGAEPSGRLEASGSFNAMVSHRVRVGSPVEVDAELVKWLKAAYDAS